MCQSFVDDFLQTLPSGINATDLELKEPAYVNGTVNYTCPDGKALLDGNTVQTWRCIVIDPTIHDNLQQFELAGGATFQPCSSEYLFLWSTLHFMFSYYC